MANTTWSTTDKVNILLSGGNLTEGCAAAGNGGVRSIASVTSGKYYFETTFGASGAVGSTMIGFANATANMANVVSTGANAAYIVGSGVIQVNAVGAGSVGAFSNNGLACFALDMGGKLVWFRNGAAGNWNGSGTNNPATGVGGVSFSGLPGGASTIFVFGAQTTTTAALNTANFGDSAFTGTVPSGFASGFPGTASVAPAIAMVLA
jgi:hypothetical protein